MGRKPKGEKVLTANERKQAQRFRDRQRLNEALAHPEDAPLRTLLQLVKEGHEFSWEEIGRRNGWLKSDGHDMKNGVYLGEDLVERFREDARRQQVSVTCLIEAILKAHLSSGKRIWA